MEIPALKPRAVGKNLEGLKPPKLLIPTISLNSEFERFEAHADL